MIHLRKNQVNRIGLTLSELSVPGDPEEYRLEFTSEDSNDIKYIITAEPVSSTKRLQIFELTEGADVTFAVFGYYAYEVYQTGANNLVENGLLMVVGEDEVIQEYIQTGKSQVYGTATELE